MKCINSVGRAGTPAVSCLPGIWVLRSVLEGLLLGRNCKEGIAEEKGVHLKIPMFHWHHSLSIAVTVVTVSVFPPPFFWGGRARCLLTVSNRRANPQVRKI